MKRKMPLLFAAVIIVAAAAFWLATNSRAATETPDYKLIRSDGKFEIRDYPPMTIATTPMRDGSRNGGFRQLFRFIAGSNQGKKKIAMTSPVLIEGAEDGKIMSFIMPKETVDKGVPTPAEKNVTLRRVDAARYAVYRFGGGRTEKNEQKATEKLRGWLSAEKIAAEGEPIFAYYDPPWTPIFMRRNEVLIPTGSRAK